MEDGAMTPAQGVLFDRGMSRNAKRQTIANMRPAERWRCIANTFRRECGDSLVDLAVNRLIHGDVTSTQYGIRVALRADLGDDRSASQSNAYWPEDACRCWSMKARGECSHELAMMIFTVDLDDIVDDIQLEQKA
jgi:hypothetical protein